MTARMPAVVVVMGVSGAGKTTIGRLLAKRLGWEFADGDEFHSRENVKKMRTGVPLTNEDRLPWLRAIAEWIDEKRGAGAPAITASSLLRRSYRDIVIGKRPDVRLVFLDGSPDLIARRLVERRGHFMPANLLDSQFAILEPPGPDEKAIRVSVESAPEQIVSSIIEQLGAESVSTVKETSR